MTNPQKTKTDSSPATPPEDDGLSPDAGIVLDPPPEMYTEPLQEYRALTTAVALIERPHEALFVVTGADRARFLHSQCTGDVEGIEPGRACRAALTTGKGKLVAELLVVAREDDLVLLVLQGEPDEVRASLESRIIADDVVITDETQRTLVVSAEGPKARDLVWRLFPGEAIPLEDDHVLPAHYQDIPVQVVRHSRTGERGFLLVAGGEHAPRIRNYLLQAGRSMHIARLGRAAWNLRRIEEGLPWWAAEAAGAFPKECRLDHLVDYEKGCYLGQETLARMHYRGHANWNLVAVAPGGDETSAPAADAQISAAQSAGTNSSAVQEPNAQGAAGIPDPQTAAGIELFAPDHREKAVGRITSPANSPRRGGLVALARVRREYAEAGTSLVGLVSGATVSFVVIPLPIEVPGE